VLQVLRQLFSHVPDTNTISSGRSHAGGRGYQGAKACVDGLAITSTARNRLPSFSRTEPSEQYLGAPKQSDIKFSALRTRVFEVVQQMLGTGEDARAQIMLGPFPGAPAAESEQIRDCLNGSFQLSCAGAGTCAHSAADFGQSFRKVGDRWALATTRRAPARSSRHKPIKAGDRSPVAPVGDSRPRS
jgi:hypothetical protein